MNDEINNESTGTVAAAGGESGAGTTAAAEHPMKTGLWVLGVVLVYYALQAWILPAAGVQT